MNHKKLINKLKVFLILLMIISFAGCKSKSNVTDITFSTWGSETEISILRPIIDDFNKKNPDINVKIIHIPQNYFEKLHMLVAANLTPDIIFINNLNLPIYTSGNIFMGLDGYLKKSNKINKDDFFPESLKTMSHNNKVLAIPRDISNVVIYYNKGLFDKYKVKYPKDNWTQEDFFETAKKLTIDTDKDGKIDIFGISFQSLVLYYLPFAWSNGGTLFNENNTQFELDQKNSCEGIQFYADLPNKYHVAPRAAEAGNSTMAQLFIQNKLAMLISGRWSVPRLREEKDLKWDVVRFPYGKAGSIVGIDGSGWAISAKSKNPDKAWRVIEYLASKDSISNFTKIGLIVPSRKDVAFSNSFLEKGLAPEHAVTFLDIIKDGKPTPQVERWNEIIDLINVNLEPVWNGNKKACTVLKAIKKDATKLLE